MDGDEVPPTTTHVDVTSPAGRWILVVTVAASSMAFLDGTVVNVALPDIGEDLHASTSSLQWILSAYLLTLASLILLGGSLGDRYGRRRVFSIGATIFAGASLLCAIAPNVETLIGARVLQGVGAALLTPGSLAVIEASFRPDQRARAIGTWSGLTGVAAAIGPLLGGYLVTRMSWRAIFVLNLPIGIFVVVMAARHLVESRDETSHGRLDVRGAVLAVVGLAGVTYALISAPDPTSEALTWATGVIGALALVAFVVAEHRSPNPMLPLGVFSSRQFSAANLVTFVIYGAIGGFFFLLVAFLQVSMGYSPLEAGAASIPVTLLMLLFSARSGALAQRIGPRVPLSVGPIVVAAGLLAMTRISPGDRYLTTVFPAVVVFGVGLTLVVAPITATVLAAADARRAGVASAVNNAVARVAGLLAVAVLPVVAGLTGDSFYDPAAMTPGFHIAMRWCAGLAAAGGVVAWVTIRRPLPATSTGAALPSTTPEPDEPDEVTPRFCCPITQPPVGVGRASGESVLEP